MTSQARRALAVIIAHLGQYEQTLGHVDGVFVRSTDLRAAIDATRTALAKPDTEDGPDLLAEAQAAHDRAQTEDVPTVGVLALPDEKYVIVLSSWPQYDPEAVRDVAERTGASVLVFAHPVRVGSQL